MTHLLLAVIYLSFCSLGFPYSLLGSAWPTMYVQFGVPVSYMGVISTTISIFSVLAGLLNERLTKKFNTWLVTTVSMTLTAIGFFGFSVSRSFWLLFALSIPYGFGVGGIDASLNNYAVQHFSSRYTTWMHCMWGLGASIGPAVMGYALTGGQGGQMGYRYISLIQLALAAMLVFSLPLWKKNAAPAGGQKKSALSLRQVIAIPGAWRAMLFCFSYCTLEQTTSLWAATYLVQHCGVTAEAAAGYASLFFIGLTAGRIASGFAAARFSDAQMLRTGLAVVLCAVIALLLPLGRTAALASLVLLGLGCAPVYPSFMHATPGHFGREKAKAVVGVQLSCAYLGNAVMPTIFGVIVNHIGVTVFPLYLMAALAVMVFMHETLARVQYTEKEGV